MLFALDKKTTMMIISRITSIQKLIMDYGLVQNNSKIIERQNIICHPNISCRIIAAFLHICLIILLQQIYNNRSSTNSLQLHN